MTIERASANRVTEPVDLLVAQLHGLDLWHAAGRRTEQSAHAPRLSREAGLDEGRRRDVRRREHHAIVETLALAWNEDARAMSTAVPARAVIAHRDAWVRDKLTSELMNRGVEVRRALDNGADAVGVCVAEQPTLFVVDELLAMRSGREVAAEVAKFCPLTVVTGYVRQESAVGDLLEAGAAAVFTRRVLPADVAENLIALVKR